MVAIQMFATPACQILANIQVCAKIQKLVTAAFGTEPMTRRIIAVSIIQYGCYECIHIYKNKIYICICVYI